MALTLAFIMDPMDRVHPAVDTSFAFMLAAHGRGHQVVHVDPAQVSLVHDQVVLHGHRVDVRDTDDAFYDILEPVALSASSCAAIFIRTDPPFNEAYLNLSWLLSFAEDQGTRIINSPRGLREANEHLYAMYFPELCPATLVSSRITEIREFVKQQGGTAIAKPIDGHAGFGVVKLAEGDSNLNALVDMLTLEGKQPVMVQKFLPEVSAGDKRLIVVDGELKGAVCRVPVGGDHRGNVHVGGRAEACDISDRDREIVAAMAPRLRKDGLFFVGLDVIGDYLIEVNVTSPTLIREIKALGGPDIAEEVIASVETTAAQSKLASVAG